MLSHIITAASAIAESVAKTFRHTYTYEDLQEALNTRNYDMVDLCIADFKERGNLLEILNHRHKPLLSAYFGPFINGHPVHPDIPDYKLMIRLLEEGLRPEGPEDDKSLKSFNLAIDKQNLALFGVMIWFESDKPEHQYEAVLRLGQSSMSLAIQRWQFVKPDILRVLAAQAADIRDVKKHIRYAEKDLQSKNFVIAARRYLEVAEACLKYQRIEAIAATEPPENPTKSAFSAFYEKQARSYQCKAYETFQLADAQYCALIFYTPEQSLDHKRILISLAQLAKALGEKESASCYHERASSIILPAEDISDATASSADSFEATDACVLRKRHQAVSLQQHRTTDPTEVIPSTP